MNVTTLPKLYTESDAVSDEIGVQIISIAETKVWIESDILGDRHVRMVTT